MPFKKGQSGNLDGRPKGSTNRITNEIKDAAINLLQDNSEKLQMWIDQIAEKDPEKAYYMVMYPQEFAFPKLARTELKHEGEIGVTGISITKLEHKKKDE